MSEHWTHPDPDVRDLIERARAEGRAEGGNECRIPAAHTAEALRVALSGITTHNGSAVTPKNLRWAATHEALCRSYIFDVLMGLADAMEVAQ